MPRRKNHSIPRRVLKRQRNVIIMGTQGCKVLTHGTVLTPGPAARLTDASRWQCEVSGGVVKEESVELTELNVLVICQQLLVIIKGKLPYDDPIVQFKQSLTIHREITIPMKQGTYPSSQ